MNRNFLKKTKKQMNWDFKIKSKTENYEYTKISCCMKIFHVLSIQNRAFFPCSEHVVYIFTHKHCLTAEDHSLVSGDM